MSITQTCHVSGGRHFQKCQNLSQISVKHEYINSSNKKYIFLEVTKYTCSYFEDTHSDTI